ncbi:ABC transporter substrate-binding protein [Rhodoglobus sp.]
MEVRPVSQIFTKRRGLSIAAAIGVGALLAGCAGGDSTGSADGPITLLTSGDADTTQGQGKAMNDIIALFTEQNGIEAEQDRVPFDQFLASATTKARAGKLGDVVEMLPGANFESLFSSVADLSKDQFADADLLSGWSATVKDVADDSVFAGVPVGAQGVVWYYNKALFEQVGLDPETPPATWDDMLATCDAFKAEGISPIGMSGSDSFILWWAWSSLSPQFFSTDDVNAVRSGDIALNDDRFLESLQPLLDSYNADCWNDDYAGKKFTDVEADFAAGKVAMVPGLVSNAINWKVWDDKLGTDAYGVFNAPKVAGTTLQGQFFNPVLMYGVSAKSANPEAALKLIETMASAEGQTILLKEASQFPNRTDVDVVGVTGSTGAGQILDIVDAVGGVDVAQNQFNGAAQSASWTNLTQTMISGDLAAFLDNLEKQQRG